MLVDRLLRASGSWSLTLLDNKRLATRAHMHTLANHIFTFLFSLGPQNGTLVTSICSARSCSRHLDPAEGAERGEAFVSDHVVSFVLSEALGWRIVMTGSADQVWGGAWR